MSEQQFSDVNIKIEEDSRPPTYTQASEDKPPAYADLFGKFQEAKSESSGNVDFAQRVIAIACCGTICTLISLAVLFSIPIANVVIGALYLDECQIERYIPIYLIVAGAFGIVKGLLQLILFIVQKCKGEDEDDEKKAKPNPVDQIINCFLFAWFIAGSVWVYSNHKKVQYEDDSANDYCHEVCYLYAFWTITITYILMALGLLCCCGGMIVACLVGGKKE